MHPQFKSQQEENRQYGKFFEQAIERLCRYQQILPLRNPLSCQFIKKGEVKLIKSGLDFTLIKKGKLVFVDCKTFSDEKFNYSQITEHQLKKACELNRHYVVAGFLCWFRFKNEVVFFLGKDIECKGKKCSFHFTEGLQLGKLEKINFDLLFNLVKV